MAADERDRRFDKALARHLRSAAPAGEPARLPAFPASQGGACTDSETLAAYHERSLLSEQLNSLKEHIVACAHCQALLAQLEATDGISLQAAEQAKSSLGRNSSRSWLRGTSNRSPQRLCSEPEPTRAGSGTTQEVTPGSSFEGRALAVARSAGAIAAGLTRLDALHEKPAAGSSKLEGSPDRDEAGAPSTRTAGFDSGAAVSPSPNATLKKPQSAADEFAPANARSAAEAMKPSQPLEYQRGFRHQNPWPIKESGLRKDAGRDSFR